MHMQHHPRRLFQIHVEKALEHDHHEFHRRVIVVQHQHLELAGLFRFGASARGQADLARATPVAGVVARAFACIRYTCGPVDGVRRLCATVWRMAHRMVPRQDREDCIADEYRKSGGRTSALA
jgi:hypothetical protein